MVLIRNVSFIDNKADQAGAAISAYNSILKISHSIFNHNKADRGGAIFLQLSTAVLNYCMVFNNAQTAFVLYNHTNISINNSIFWKNSGLEVGGALYVFEYCHLNVLNTEFRQNSAALGGAISISGDSIILMSNCSFSENIALHTMSFSFYLGHGGVIFIVNATLKVYQSRFFNNYVDKQGGSVCSINSSLLIENSEFENNVAGFAGGAISLNHSFVTIENSSFVNNSEQDGEIGGGGAIYLYRSKLDTSQTKFYKNYAQWQGGSVLSLESLLFMKVTNFKNNTADFSGGAISVANETSVIIEDSLFMENSAMFGVLYFALNCSVVISNVTFTENKVIGSGTILAQNLCKITIFNSLFVENTGSAINLMNDNTLYINDCTFCNNSRAIIGVSNCEINVTDTQFTGNHADEGGSLYVSKATNVYLYNCIFYNNNARLKGGAIYAVNSSINTFFCNFIKNSATSGGVFAVSGNLFVTDSAADNNIARDGDGAVAHLDVKCQANFTNSNFTDNKARGSGGVLSIKNGTVNVWNSYFIQNKAMSSGGVIDAEATVIKICQSECIRNEANRGGVLAGSMNVNIFINDSKMQNNSATACGVMFTDATSILEINHSQVEWNKALIDSGALCVFKNSLLISTTSSFRRNMGYFDGSLFVQNSTGYLENCTFIENQGTYAGAITISIYAELRLSNTKFLNNMAQDWPSIDSRTYINKFINKLYTYRSKFSHDNKTLKSNSINFKEKAIKEGFLKESSYYDQNNLATEETHFASSKL